MTPSEELRRRVSGLVAVAGEQQLFAREIGVHQSIVSRYMTGGRLTLTLAKGLHARYPDLRDLVTLVHYGAQDMPVGNEETAEAAAS